MQELTFEQLEDVSGGVDLDWGDIWIEAANGAVTGGEIGGVTGVLIPALRSFGFYGMVAAAGIGASMAAYDETVEQLEEKQKSTNKENGKQEAKL